MNFFKKINDLNKFTTFLLDVYKVVSFCILLFEVFLIFSPLNVSIYFASPWLFMYSHGVLGLILGIMGNLKKADSKAIGRIGKIALIGNLMVVILFFLPFYLYWSTLLELLLTNSTFAR